MTTGNITIGSSSLPFYSSKVWSGANDPAHKAWNPYTMTAFRQEKEPSIRIDRRTGVTDYPYMYGSTLWYPWTPNFSANDQIQLLADIADKARGHSFNAGVFAAEFNQTLDLVGDRSKRVLDFLRYASRGRFLKAVRALNVPGLVKRGKAKSVADFVLEMRYGWLPLLGDIYEGMRFVESKTREPRTLTFKSSKTVVVANNSSTSPSRTPMHVKGKFTRRYIVVMTEQLSTARSLGLLNPAAVLWEKLPWSFVADWFIPIGTYLDVIGVIPHMKSSWRQTDFGRAGGFANSSEKLANDPYYRYIGGSCRYSAVRMVRYAESYPSRETVPLPTLAHLDKAFSLTHIQNLSALIASNLSRIRR